MAGRRLASFLMDISFRKLAKALQFQRRLVPPRCLARATEVDGSYGGN